MCIQISVATFGAPAKSRLLETIYTEKINQRKNNKLDPAVRHEPVMQQTGDRCVLYSLRLFEISKVAWIPRIHKKNQNNLGL